jgi:hypothetical protein
MRRRDARALSLGAAMAAGSLLLAGAAGGQSGPGYGESGPLGPNPCIGEDAALLLCPNLQMAKPRELKLSKGKRKLLLRATNDIRSRGEGPLEVRGKRSGRRTMTVRQAIHVKGGGRRFFKTNARLVFYNIPGQGPYWKFNKAARFEIWTLGSDGRRESLIRMGPKLNYCFRDLERTLPSPRSPKKPVYPACSQNPKKRFRTLGTSVGWSDIYPSSYHENWINVRGLRGCFSFVLRADPANHLYENDESDNVGARRIRLPAKRGKVRPCSP